MARARTFPLGLLPPALVGKPRVADPLLVAGKRPTEERVRRPLRVLAAPVVSGTPTIGQTLTSTLGSWSGEQPITYARQWLRDGVEISGATNDSYLLAVADYDADITCRITATNALGTVSAVSNALGPVAAVVPSNVVAPVVSGTPTEDETLSCTTGSWTGTTPISYTFQWRRDGSPILGATATTYTLVTADVGTLVDCVVTATNVGGSDSQDSNDLGPIASSGGVAPTITVAPVLTWTVAHGSSPTITEGSYTGDAGTWTYNLVRLPSTNVLTGVSKAAVEAYVSDRATDVGPSWKVAGTITNGTGADSADSNTVEYDPSSVASYYADYDPDTGAEVTTGNPAADGDTVQRLLDKAPGARHLTQATPGNRPTYEVGDGPNGHDRIFFTASALTRMEATMSLAQPSTIFMVGRSPFSATNMYFYDGTSTRQAAVKLSGNYSILAPTPACALAIPTADTWFLDEAEFNGASSSHRVDDGTPATGNAGTATLSNLRVGAGNTIVSSIALDGDIARLVIFSAVLSAADKADVRAYLAHLYGVTV